MGPGVGGGKGCSVSVLIHPVIPSLSPFLPFPQISLLPLGSMLKGQYKYWGMAVDFQRWWPSDLKRAGRVRRDGRRKGGREGRREEGRNDRIHESGAYSSLPLFLFPSLPPSLHPSHQTQFIEVDCGTWPRVAFTVDEPERVYLVLSQVRRREGGREGGREGERERGREGGLYNRRAPKVYGALS